MKDAGTSILGLISQIISSVVWPATVLTRVIVLRRHLLALVPLVSTAKYSDAEIRFGKQVAELVKTTDSSSIPAHPSQAKRRQ